MTISAQDLSKLFDLEICGGDVIVEHLGLCNRDNLRPNTLSYVTGFAYLDIALQNEMINAIIVDPKLLDRNRIYPKTILYSYHPQESFYEILNYFSTQYYLDLPDAIIGKNSKIHKTAIIEAGVVIGENVTVGAFSIIHSHSTIGDNTTICSHCTIGSNGFQALKRHSGEMYNVKHIGGVVIGRNCYVAEFVNISRGLFDTDVIIGDNVLIDVGCHIAHDCQIGKNSVLTVNTKMFGSSSIGENVWMSPGSMVMNRIRVSDGCAIAPGSFVMSNTVPDTRYIGNPAIKECSYIKREVKLRKLLK